MYFQRKIDAFLWEWKNDKDRKPLIIRGARQIGKTESVSHFAEAAYSNVIYINFALEKKYTTIANDGYDADDIIRNISLIDPDKRFTENDTLIVFDEIQEYPDIATSLKSFNITRKYDVICTGSMLGINYKRIHSNSVGNKSDYEMRSMDFEEYLWAKGYESSHIEELFSHMRDIEPFNVTEMNTFKSLFMEYCVTGGMPAVVRSYIQSGNFSGTLEMQRQIQLDYEEDVRKYAESLDQTKIISVYRSIPAQLARENKKFQFNKVSKNARSRDYAGCIEWLKDAGIIDICYCLNYPELPLKGNCDMSKFKIYYPDTGLLIASLDEEAQEDLRLNRNLGVYKGGLYENFVAEAFSKQGLDLYYYKKENSTLEEDFFVRNKDSLIPVEVKANTKKSKSLESMIKNENYHDVKFGIKLTDGNIGYTNNIYTFPYFCAFLIKRYTTEGIN